MPEKVKIAGVEYELATDYRSGLRAILAHEDETLTPHEKNFSVLQNIFYYFQDKEIAKAILLNEVEASEKANWFLNGGDEKKANGEAVSQLRLYSFEKDANFIFSAFKATHGIDLQRDDVHWWTFLALFMDLGQDTTFCQIVSLRQRVATGKATKEEVNGYNRMSETLHLEQTDDRTFEEKEVIRKFDEQVAATTARKKKEKENVKEKNEEK